MRMMVLAGLLAAAASPALAQDRVIDVGKPEVIVQALQEEGYKAALKKHDDGRIFIDSAANGSPFTVEFIDCTPEKGCGSAQFFAWYKKQPWFTPDLANRWNAKMRFIKVAIDKDGDLSTYMDFSTLGKTTYANFADTIDWWASLSGDLTKFVDEEEAKAAKPKP
jgi:hypothetical protein